MALAGRVAWWRAGFLVPGFGTSVARFGSVGKEDEEVRGDEPTVCLFNSVTNNNNNNNNNNNRQLRLANVRQSLSQSLGKGSCRSRPTHSSRIVGAFYPVSPTITGIRHRC